MTIEEAITQLKDLRKDRESFAKSDEPGEVFEQDIEAIDVALEHMDKHGTYISMNAHRKLMKENAELKRLLRLAVDDIAWSNCNMGDSDECPDCPYYSGKPGRCLNDWQHAEEALKLIGDDK